MIRFIFGSNSYLLQKKLREIEADFLKLDSSGINLDKIEGVELTLAKFQQAVNAMPFLAPKRLIIIRNFLLENKDSELKNKITDYIDSYLRKNGKKDGKNGSASAHDTVDLIFIEGGEPDKRTRLFKGLLKLATVIEAKPLEGPALSKFVMDQLTELGIESDHRTIETLLISAGGDMQKLQNELDKLALYIRSQGRKKLIVSDIEQLVVPELNPNAFAFTKSLAKKDAKASIKLLADLLSSGENEQKLMGTIAYQFRTLIIIRDCLDRGMKPQEIAGAAKLAPFAVTKNLPIAQSKKIRTLVGMYESLRRTDAIIKTSAIPADLAMSIFVATLCK